MNLNSLYEKIKEFEVKLTPKFRENLTCKKGCNQCCYVDLSIFEIEADNIRNWLENLSRKDQESIKEKLYLIQEKKIDFEGKESLPCVFLKGDQCLIYPVRPLICRSQGNAFAIQDESKSFIDICPLNEETLNYAKKNDFINLNLLNSILAKLNIANGFGATRIKLAKIKEEFLKV